MNERDLFLSALEIEDLEHRRAHVQAACADNAALLTRVESLLASHEGESRFLQTPVVEQLGDNPAGETAATIVMGTGSTQDEKPSGDDSAASVLEFSQSQERVKMADEIPLGYLEPSTKPGSLGRLGHYEILEVIGRGAFGTVLRAFDETLQRVVAIKVMAPELAATSPARKRFVREAQASAQIRHENVVSVYAVEERPIPHLVMEYVPGVTLQQRLDERGPLDVPTTLRLGMQIAEGLAAAHGKDLIHRDIKPGNILLETGLRDRVKITDFGLARAADDASMTQSGMIAGTPMYMAPEQALGHKLDQRADLFSLGSVLYQMVSGRPPFRASSTLAVLKRLTEETPRPIKEIISETPRWLCDIISKLHAKNPDDRFQSAKEVAELLEQHLAHQQNPSQVIRPAAVSLAPTVERPVTAKPGTEKTGPEMRPLMVPVGIRWPLLIATGIMFLAAVILLVITEATGVTELFQGSRVAHVNSPPNAPQPDRKAARNPFGVADVDDPDGADVLGFAATVNLGGTETDANAKPFMTEPVSTAGASIEGEWASRWSMPGHAPGTVAWTSGTAIVKSVGNRVYIFYKDDQRYLIDTQRVGKDRLVGRYLNLDKPNVSSPWVGRIINAERIDGQWTDGRWDMRRKVEASPEPGWVQLFNGKDLTGWKTHPEQAAVWRVADGILTCRGPKSHLFSERGDYRDFQLRFEWRTSQQEADSGVYFRCDYSINRGFPPGYELNLGRGDDGSLMQTPPTQLGGNRLVASRPIQSEVNQWRTGELTVVGQRLTASIDGNVVVEFDQLAPSRPFGHIALEHLPNGNPACFVEFRKIEIKELPLNSIAKQEPLPPTHKNTIGMEFVIVPKGKSWLGGGNDKLGDKEVEIPADFYLGKYEVTQEEWEKVMGENPSHFSRNGEGMNAMKDIPDADLKRFPVENVSWDQCQSFIAKLNTLQNEKGWVYRLPKEAEWEYACRGGPVDKLDSAFDFYFAKPTNILLPEQANFEDGKGLKRTCKVGLYEPNSLGLYDLHGNVWEWCDDNEKGAAGASLRVNRGGGWNCESVSCRAVRRQPFGGASPPSDRHNVLGLRVARVPSGAASPEVKTPPTNPDRRAAEYVLSLGGTVRVDGPFHDIKAAVDLPREEFRLKMVILADNKQVSDAGLAHFKDSKNLTDLQLRKTRVSDAGLAHFKDCKNLRNLDLGYTQVGDAGLANLKDCKNLTHLHLQSTQVSDAGLAHHKDRKDLTYLNLYDTQVSDAGLVNLKDCKNLAWLTLLQTKVTAAGIDELKKALPKCKIEWDGGVIEPSVGFPPFTDADVQRIAALPAAEQVEEVRKELKRRNPGFDGKLTPTIETDVVTALSINSDEIIDIAPVRALTGLIYLDCRGTYPNKGKLFDLSPLKGMTFSRLDCSSTQIADLTPLAGLPLTYLHFNHNPVSDLTPLKGMSLQELGLAETKVSDLSPLKGMKLRILGAQLLPVTDLSPLEGMPLTGLDLYHTIGVTSLEPLAGMPLEGLNLQDVPVSDLSPLKGMTTLRTLLLQGNKVSDLTPLAGLKLTDLLLQDKQITDLAPLRGLPLTRLVIHNTGVSDLRPLEGMPLAEIRLNPKNITQGLEILRAMKSLKTIGVADNQAWPPAEFWERYDKGEFKE